MYKPSIWDAEMSIARQDYICTILQQNGCMTLRNLALCLSVLAKEPYHGTFVRIMPKFHDSSYRRTLSRDIHEINYSSDFPIIIVHSTKGVKIGSKDDAKKFVDSCFNEGVKKIALAQRMARKLSLDGQLTISQDIINAYESEENHV